MDKVIQIQIEPDITYVRVTCLTQNGKIWVGCSNSLFDPQEQLSKLVKKRDTLPMAWTEIELPPNCSHENKE